MDGFTERSVTYVPVTPPRDLVSCQGIHFFMGSCFAENLYSYLKDRFIHSHFSPFGNIYNPLSLAVSIKRLCSDELISDDELFEHKELWRHFDFDTQFCSLSRDEYLESLNTAQAEARDLIRKSSRLYLTLGTAYVYRQKKTGQVVNNCHKLPSSQFVRDCASISEMKEAMTNALQELLNLNPSLKIIITLSPVRHLRDNPQENSLSKARLRCLIDELSSDFDMWYFPAYEILLDQLRDYRWFGKDMTHPSEQAVEYIMERFVTSAADDQCKVYLRDISKLKGRLDHKLLHSQSTESQKFLESTKKLFNDLAEKYPDMELLKQRCTNYVHESERR